MNTVSILSLFYGSASVHKIIDSVIEDICDGRNVFLLLTEEIDRMHISSHVFNALYRKEFIVEKVDVSEIEESLSLADALGQRLQITWEQGKERTIGNLLNSDGLPEVIILEGLETLEDGIARNWIKMLDQWVQQIKTSHDAGARSTLFFTAIPAMRFFQNIPNPGPSLSLRWWWGIPSTLETQCLCRACIENGATEGKLQAQWVESIVPGIIGNDVDFGSFILEALYEPMEAIETRLIEYAHKRSWKEEILKKWGIDETFCRSIKTIATDSISPLMPPPKLRELWSKGIVSWTPENGAEIHLAAIAVLGWKNEIRHRFWREQAKLLLPVIDSLRIHICEKMTSEYGDNWHTRYCTPSNIQTTELQESPLACEWGYLEYIFKTVHAFRKQNSLLSLIMQARSIRNKLAHYQTIDYFIYAKFIKEYQAKARLLL